MKKFSASTNGQWVGVGEWTRRILKVKGVWKYLYSAVDKEGKTVDFLLAAKRNKVAPNWFFEKAMRHNGDPEKVTMDKSGANKAAIDGINDDRDAPIEVRQIKYLNKIIVLSSA